MYARAFVPILWLALLLQGCGPAPTQAASQEPAASGVPSATVPAEATATSTATPQPTAGPTATVWPPVFVPWTLQDIRNLDSFVVTINEKNTFNGQLTELTNTIGYIKEPFRAYNHNQYYSGVDRMYVLDGWTYSLTGSGDWYISAGSKEDVFYKADIPAGNTEKLREAQFAGLEDYQGIPAYHFVLEPVMPADGSTGNQVEGDLYIAQDGNYVLYSHWKESSSLDNVTQTYEVTETLSSVNQLADIQLPDDMKAMVAAVELPAGLGLPLPGDSSLAGIIRYKHGIGVDLYSFTHPDMSVDEFLDYYRNLPETNGWKVTHVGHVNLHQDDCEFTRECVMMSKGDTQVILYYDGAGIRVEFDWPHLYSPL